MEKAGCEFIFKTKVIWVDWEVPGACVGLNDCGYFTVESRSQSNRSFSSRWLWYRKTSDAFRNTLCPWKAEQRPSCEMRCLRVTRHPERELKPLGVWLRSLWSSLPKQMFSKAESLPVTTEALERSVLSLNTWFSFSLRSRSGHCSCTRSAQLQGQGSAVSRQRDALA